MTEKLHTPWVLLIIALFLFVPLFLTGGTERLDFWQWMTLNAVIILLLIFLTDKKYALVIKEDLQTDADFKIVFGLLSALVLYLIFAAGNYISHILPFARTGIANIYSLKGSTSPVLIAFRLLFIIGPGEELIWRGYFQRVFWDKYGVFAGFAIATFFYFAMHLASLNIMLLVASGVCGLFWGVLYIKYRSILLNVVSHTAWDLAVFLIFPFS